MRHPAEEDWSVLYDQNFTQAELREAADFGDCLASYNVSEDVMKEFIRDDMKLGQRLYLIINLPQNELGVMAMREPDDRLVHIIKLRCAELKMEADGRKSIILPGEE